MPSLCPFLPLQPTLTLEQREGAVLSAGDVGRSPVSNSAQDGAISLTSVTSGAYPAGCL